MLNLFVEYGYDGTSIDAIAAEVGIAKRTFYQRYGDKESLFRSAMQQAIRQWIVPVATLQAAESDSLDVTLLAIGRLLVNNILSPDGLRLIRLTNAESARMPEIGAYNVKLGTEPTIEFVCELLERHLGMRPAAASEAADVFINLVVGGPANAAVWGVAMDPEQVDDRIAFSVHTFLHGCGGDLQVRELRAEIARLETALTDARTVLAQNHACMAQVLGAGGAVPNT